VRTGRDPLAIHEEQLTPLLLTLFDPWLEKLPDAAFDQFVQHLDHMIDLFHEQPRALGLLELAAGGIATRCPSRPTMFLHHGPKPRTNHPTRDHSPQRVPREPLPPTATAAPQPRP